MSGDCLPAGHFLLRPFRVERRAEVAIRRLHRFGFRPKCIPYGGAFLVVIPLESGSTPSRMLRDLRMCARDVVHGAEYVGESGEVEAIETAVSQ